MKKRGPYGHKMIKVSVYFWCNNLPAGTDEKTAWASGAIHMNSNKVKGIKHNSVLFNSTSDDFLPKFNELLKKNDVKLIKQTGKYVETNLN